MTPDHKCPRCGTLRPSSEVAHTCVVVRSTVPDHEAAKMSRESMEREYQQWTACLAKLHADLDAAGVPRADAKVCNDPTCDSKIVHRVRDLVAREQRAVELLREIGKWERMFDDPDARMVVTKIDAFLAERGEV